MKTVLNTIFGKAKLYEDYYIIVGGVNDGKKLHRLIYESFHKICLLPNTVIHHIDGNKLNNCILNLEMLTRGQHTTLHWTGRHHTEETKIKISNSKKGRIMPEHEKEHLREIRTIKEPRIIKIGFAENGKQRYAIKKGKKVLTKSVDLNKLEKKLDLIKMEE